MPTKRLTLDVGDKFDKLLTDEASSSDTTKADLIRRAVATYVYLKREAGQGGKIEIKSADGKSSKEVVFP